MSFYYIIALLVLLLLNCTLFPSLISQQVKEVDYGTFMQMLKDKKVKEVEIQENQIVFSDTADPANYYKTGKMDDPELVQRLSDSGATFGTEIVQQQSALSSILLYWVLPTLIFIALGELLVRKMASGTNGLGNAMTFGKSGAKVYVPSETGIKFSDVAGEEEAKEALSEIVDFLHDPTKYNQIGAHMPKGALLVGPPGTGKTLLAKAVAGEAEVPFFSIAGSEFVEMFVGMGASKVRDLFKQANEKAPCIVFIDEIDTIGKKRDAGALGGNDEREQTLNQLLTEMDGFDGSQAAWSSWPPPTVRTSWIPALLRPGRFDRRVPVELPDLAGREAILKVHAKKVMLSDDVDFNAIARASAGCSGAELANLVNEAALRAVRMHRQTVNQSDLEESIEVVIAGYQKKNKILSDDERASCPSTRSATRWWPRSRPTPPR
jgi:cell division protease FtsH